MLGLVKVLGRVRIDGIIATADVAAFETEPQVHPLVAGRETFFAALGCPRLDGVNMREVLALLVHTAVP
jgi:hypothetical protein